MQCPPQECFATTYCSTDLGAIQGTWQDAIGNRFVLVADTGQSIANPIGLTVQSQGAEEKAIGLLRKECDRLGSRIIWCSNDVWLDLECITETRFLVGDRLQYQPKELRWHAFSLESATPAFVWHRDEEARIADELLQETGDPLRQWISLKKQPLADIS